MKDPTTPTPRDSECGDVKAAFRACIAGIDLVRREMDSGQEEIDGLKAETREILSRLKAA